jgi:hypothetical protein
MRCRNGNSGRPAVNRHSSRLRQRGTSNKADYAPLRFVPVSCFLDPLLRPRCGSFMYLNNLVSGEKKREGGVRRTERGQRVAGDGELGGP